MKLTIRELKQLIKEQIEEAGELASAAKGAPIRHSQSNTDKQGMPPPGSLELDPRDPITPGKSSPSRCNGTTLEEELEEQEAPMTPATVQENIRKMVREAMAQLTEKKKGLPPWLKPGFKDKKNKEEEEKDETNVDEKEKDVKDNLKDKKKKNSKLDEARLLNLIKEAIKQNLNKAGKAIAKKGTKDVAKEKKAGLQKKDKGDWKMSARDRKELQRVQFTLNAKKAKK